MVKNTYQTGVNIIIGFFISIIAAALLNGCSSSTPQKRYITLIGTADLQGAMELSEQEYDVNGSVLKVLGGGISRIAALIKEAKAENPEGTFVLSSGDDLMGRYFHTFKGNAIFSLMSQGGYEIFVPGNHEFDKGPEVFAGALGSAAFHTVCSDLAVEDTPLEGKCVPFRIMKYRTFKIGFFSLMTESFPLITSPGSVRLRQNNLQSAREMVALLKGKGCDMIVAVTHIGLEQDKKLAEAVEGIDVIYGGHSHEITKKIVHAGNTLIVNGGEQGSYVIKLVLPLDGEGNILKEKADYHVIPVLGSITPDNSTQTLLDAYKAQLPKTIVLGKTTVEWDLTTDTLRKGESNVADMINDLLRNKFGVDIVMNNAGAFRGKKIYPPGDITDTMLHEIDEFSNNAYIMSIKGQYLREILEHSATLYEQGGLMQVSGLAYTIDLRQTAQKTVYENGKWHITQKGSRVVSAQILSSNGTYVPLEDMKQYTVLTNAYLVNHTGDGYYWFKTYGTDYQNTYTTFYSIMAGYLENHDEMNPAPTDGRLKIIGN